jgi:hypothetical protein
MSGAMTLTEGSSCGISFVYDGINNALTAPTQEVLQDQDASDVQGYACKLLLISAFYSNVTGDEHF